jgi:hypothetical protein
MGKQGLLFLILAGVALVVVYLSEKKTTQTTITNSTGATPGALGGLEAALPALLA